MQAVGCPVPCADGLSSIISTRMESRALPSPRELFVLGSAQTGQCSLAAIPTSGALLSLLLEPPSTCTLWRVSRLSPVLHQSTTTTRTEKGAIIETGCSAQPIVQNGTGPFPSPPILLFKGAHRTVKARMESLTG